MDDMIDSQILGILAIKKWQGIKMNSGCCVKRLK